MRFILFITALLFVACSKDPHDPQRIINETIKVHGGKKFDKSRIEFDFRDRHYVADRNNGRYSYERLFRDSTNEIHDYLTNDGFIREVNGEKVNVPDTMVVKYQRSVNSTIYFASLPYGLNDAAVIKEFAGETTIDNEPYYIVKVTFKEEGGGEDHSDTYYYWIHQQEYSMDYFAYSYRTDGGGIRFRKAIKQHAVNGVILQDYINYAPENSLTPIDSVESLYKRNELKEFSRIEITNVSVGESKQK